MRKTRSDCRVGAFEKKHGLPPGTIRNKDGRDTRSDKKIGTIRKEAKQENTVLQIDSFRNLSKEKVMEFTSMIPYMEKEVAMEVIKQFPVYVDFAKTVIEHYTQICETILATNKEEYEKAVDAHQCARVFFKTTRERKFNSGRKGKSFR